MYFSATLKGSNARTHCVGTALSTTITGPYTSSSQIFACPKSEGGAIDPDGFRDLDGTRYVTYKSMEMPEETVGFVETPIILDIRHH
jgi:beta-xylosidase